MPSVLERLRKICASFPDVTEGTHSGAIAWKGGGKLFATYREKGGDCEVVFGLEPDHLDLLLATDPRFTRYARAPAAVIRGSEVRDWGEMRDLLRESYELVVPRVKPKAKPKRAGSKRARR